jgi:hypothetical protein
MDQSIGLSLEQKFSLRSFETQVERMSHEQAQDFLVKLYEQMMLRETMYKVLASTSPIAVCGDLPLWLGSQPGKKLGLLGRFLCVLSRLIQEFFTCYCKRVG